MDFSFRARPLERRYRKSNSQNHLIKELNCELKIPGIFHDELDEIFRLRFKLAARLRIWRNLTRCQFSPLSMRKFWSRFSLYEIRLERLAGKTINFWPTILITL